MAEWNIYTFVIALLLVGSFFTFMPNLAFIGWIIISLVIILITLIALSILVGR